LPPNYNINSKYFKAKPSKKYKFITNIVNIIILFMHQKYEGRLR